MLTLLHTVFFTGEQEVLIMLGSIFRLTSIDYQDQVWIIQLTLCSDNDDNLKPIFEYMKNGYDKAMENRVYSHLVFCCSRWDNSIRPKNIIIVCLTHSPRCEPPVAHTLHFIF